MSYFMQNLIERHQQGTGIPEASRIIQPRPKARFESNLGVADFIQNETGHDYGQAASPEPESRVDLALHNVKASEPLLTGRQALNNTQTPVLQSIDNSTAEIEAQQPFGDLNQRIDALTAKFGQKKSVSAPLITVIENKAYQQEETQHQTERPESTIQVDNQNLSITEQLNQRIQATLQHLNSQTPPASTDNIVVEVQQEPLFSDTNNSVADRVEQIPYAPEPTPNVEEPPVKLKKTAQESQKERTKAPQAGVLQIPGWLAAMQADLNRHWQEDNGKPEVEPVVNVTIGRVEVRAVQADSAKQPKTRNKPSGVMSLDDYLKQRDSRGRA